MRILALISICLILLSGCTGEEKEAAAPPTGNMGVKDNLRSVPPAEMPDANHAPQVSEQEARPARHPRKKKAVLQAREALPTRAPDSILIERIARLRQSNIIPDLNEPVTRDYLMSRLEEQPFPSVIELSRERYFRLQLDNDLLDNTDRFYTNGIRLEYICPALSGSPLSKLMVPYWHPGINYYGMALVQNMYTSSKTKEPGILYGDRPYAAYLYVSAFRITNDKAHRMRQTGELQVGIIGPASMGGTVQTWFHESVPTNNRPQGWDYQIQNDLLLNYSVSWEKGLVAKPFFELTATGSGIVGTVYTGLNAGFLLRTGAMQPYFSSLGFSKRSVNLRTGMRNAQYYLFMRASGTAVGYDATLQGGMFNHSSVYTLPADSITRVRFNGSAGVALSWGGARLDVEQHCISPEFTGGLWHFWMGIGLTFSF